MSSKPWSLPYTKSMSSTLVPRGPWHYAFTLVAVHARGDKDKLVEAVPEPLELSPDAEIWFYIGEILSVSDSNPELNQELHDTLQYYEAAIFLKTLYEGERYAYCSFMWVDKDLPLIRGFVAGFPKKLAHISMTKLHPLLPYYDKPRRGLRVGAFASRLGYKLFSMKLQLEDKIDKLPFDDFGEWVLPRYFPKIGDLAGASELVVFEPDYLRYGEIWRAKVVDFVVEGGVNDEMTIFKPVEILGGYYYTMAVKPKRLRLLTELQV